ncbi:MULTISPECIES: LmbU family transcriptional regulator [unclassified Streptomyces]|uniref:LmbU family transcriptional regulator n=1 Tax=unclassified Streptomyces TaxID=2593676 RepID=UPI000AC9AFD0|nr:MULTISPECIES: LmbU family transcriptional regulator [unclassified Streptomyces]
MSTSSAALGTAPRAGSGKEITELPAVRPRQTTPDDAARGVFVTRVGLQIPAAVSYDTWKSAGRRISAVANSSAWCLGDWLIYGQWRYTDRYRRAVDAVGLDYQTLRNYAWVARRFEVSRRRDSLSFHHHAEVASLPPHEQDYWLNRAEELGWSRNQLRANVRAARETEPSATRKTASVGIQLTPERIARYRAAAERSDSSLETWMVDRLDLAANNALGSYSG